MYFTNEILNIYVSANQSLIHANARDGVNFGNAIVNIFANILNFCLFT